MNQFTFKQQPKRTGLASVGEAGRCFINIKLNGKEVGMLYKGGFDTPIDIRFMIYKKDIMEDKNPNCLWMWKTLKYHPNTIQEAKDFIRKFSKDIQDKFQLAEIERQKL